MNSSQIEKNVKSVIDSFDEKTFIYDLLLAYGISKTSITRLKNGDFNLSSIDGEVLYKKKLLFKVVDAKLILTTIDEISKNVEALRHNPRFVIVTDYQTLLAKDIRTGQTLDTPLLDLYKHFDFFLPWAGHEKYHQKTDDYADRKASYEMAKLYDILVHENPNIYADGGHDLNIFLSRILFCFFAEDTDIFPTEGMFTDTLAQHTKSDGSDVHFFLDRLFTKLNSKDAQGFPAFLSDFPYVNGGLFRNQILSPIFSANSRKIILECGSLIWSEINPDIFGSMIQAVVNPEYRSGLGMHYTSVPNIMKVIEPLFLNDLFEEFEKGRESPTKLRKLLYRISRIQIFDPACGSGNFLIIAYKELRRLEIRILQLLNELEPQKSIVFTEIKLTQFYGIELDDFAHEMAILSLWLVEHQMNKEFVNDLHDFGKAKPILPLKEAGNIYQGNSTRLDWETVCPKNINSEIYILGNPPYYGTRNQKKVHKDDMTFVFKKVKNYKTLDYIAAWFFKASVYIKNSDCQFAFVTTNSICQGDQVSILWEIILEADKEIFFAHQTFKWTNNAKSNAGVSVVVIGVRNRNARRKNKFLWNGILKKSVSNINAYLVEGADIIVSRKSKSISDLPVMIKGSIPADGGHLIINYDEVKEFEADIRIRPLIKKFVGAQELIKGIERWCLYIQDDDLEKVVNIPAILRRLEGVKKMRLDSTKQPTVELANYPHRFAEDRYQNKPCLLIPCVTSEEREYVPIGFVEKGPVIYASAQAIYDPEPWIFAVTSSKMHNCWIKAVGGRLDSRIRYSSSICYNTFPFPKINAKQKEILNLHVFNILEEREKHPEKTLAKLYDSGKMPEGLKNAHLELDLAVERCYRLKLFENDAERLEYLFKQYELTTLNKD